MGLVKEKITKTKKRNEKERREGRKRGGGEREKEKRRREREGEEEEREKERRRREGRRVRGCATVMRGGGAMHCLCLSNESLAFTEPRPRVMTGEEFPLFFIKF